ncbi:Hydrophobic dipeptide epimerase [Hyella patelloides LEGE 07179]|uniref:Dipeptide epimerase n=1 Tax=Hyella patelloides LEGE 07179 TaxID=945734 RepID=A0A563VZT3_9CYAN|nr:dipeptide epimerase [Hyella patelloides]VEP16972.1 Hydrophobic dipeptide epimerase [Hyella patelloides LEGE 07179]
MELIVQTFTVRKKFALKISRGTTDRTTNLWVKIKEDDLEGWGEASPFSISKAESKDTAKLEQEIIQISPRLAKFHPLQRQEIAEILDNQQVPSSVKAAIDTALYDWLGKKVGLPLWQLWGLNRDRIVPISVTIGISSPENAVKRGLAWQETIDFQILKLKLGNPEGIEADKAMLEAIRSAFPQARLTVDANGGWSFNDAVYMSHWLANLGVEYIEQPLAVAENDKLATLSKNSPLPIFVDESCFNSSDIPRLASSVAGVNLKIMKTGGLTEAKRTIEIAKAFGLQVMFGCYSDSSLANTAMSHLAPLADYLDLDSHLNLINDPFSGATISEGRLLPNNQAGLGVEYHAYK